MEEEASEQLSQVGFFSSKLSKDGFSSNVCTICSTNDLYSGGVQLDGNSQSGVGGFVAGQTLTLIVVIIHVISIAIAVIFFKIVIITV